MVTASDQWFSYFWSDRNFFYKRFEVLCETNSPDLNVGEHTETIIKNIVQDEMHLSSRRNIENTYFRCFDKHRNKY
jgi:hypothetical protein